MDLPRIASQTSLCQSNIKLLTDYKPRTPVSQRLLNATAQPPEPQFAVLPSSSHYQPSRKREEARVLQNLKKKFLALRVVQANSHHETVESSNNTTKNNNEQQLDNRPSLLQKILLSRPMSMVLDVSDLQTAWQDSDFITDCLCWHNVYRQRHTSPPLTMSSELCYLAQTWANHLAHTNKFYYRNDKDIGQNLFCRPLNAYQTDVTGQEVASYWYSAVKQYDYGKEPDVLHVNVNAGHFTQVIWANSRHFGVGKATSRAGKVLVVAHYFPAGNISGTFQENVLPPCLEVEYPSLPTLPRFIVSSESTETASTASSSSST